MKRGNELIKNKVHPTTIISGYKNAVKEACLFIENNLRIPVSSLGEDALLNVARTSMNSKLIGPESNLFAKLAVDAILAVEIKTAEGEKHYPVNSINILKNHG